MGRWALDVAFVWKAALTLGLVLLYYCFSIGITFYNKWLTKVTGPRAAQVVQLYWVMVAFPGRWSQVA